MSRPDYRHHIHHTPNCAVFTFTLRGSPTLYERRSFQRCLHRRARELGLVLSQKHGLCIAFGAERICTNAHRHQLLTWLVDHPEVAQVELSHLHALRQIVAGQVPALQPTTAHAAAWASNASTLRNAWRKAALGAARQWSSFISGRMA